MQITYIGEFNYDSPLYLKPGQLALLHEENSIRQIWWYRCPCGNGGVLNGHTVSSTEPVNITPFIVCPGGCHYYIRNGMIV